MSLLTLAEVIFFLSYGISHFSPFRHSNVVTAVSAIAVGVLLLVKY
ncbi:MAG: hypothetical protein M3Q34_00030 [bacterium]|nr:hypothetical protein [bacterium]